MLCDRRVADGELVDQLAVAVQTCYRGAVLAVEVLPGTNHPEIMMPVHQHCLAEAGVHLVENLSLSELIQNEVSEFCLIMLPIKLKGATGCPVRPIAVI